jgi:hypothetical protein
MIFTYILAYLCMGMLIGLMATPEVRKQASTGRYNNSPTSIAIAITVCWGILLPLAVVLTIVRRRAGR